MSESVTSLIDSAALASRLVLRAIKRTFAEPQAWRRRQYAAPSTAAAKRGVLMRNSFPDSTWVETGTYLGETTAFLAQRAGRVYSLEPAEALFLRASRRFRRFANVEIINGASETVFPKLLPRLSGPVNFWLDGHYSAGLSFRGAKDTPVIEELAEIRSNLAALAPVSIMIDDIRCFDPAKPEFASYPPLDFLVDWARDAALGWHIEHDIFVARSPG